MVKKTLEQIIRHYYITLHASSRNIDLSPKRRKRDQKIKKISADFSFFQSSFMTTSSSWYHDWHKNALACFEACWNEVKNMRGAKFWRKNRSQCGKDRCKTRLFSVQFSFLWKNKKLQRALLRLVLLVVIMGRVYSHWFCRGVETPSFVFRIIFSFFNYIFCFTFQQS